MGALHLAIFILISIQAIDAFAQTPDKSSERLSVRQELALQERNTDPTLAQALTEADGSPSRDPADENQFIALSSWDSVDTTSNPGLVVSNNAPCSPVNQPPTTITGGKLKRRGLKQRRGAPPQPESICPVPAATDTDTHPSKQPQTEEQGREQGPALRDGSPQPEDFKWPNMFKLPTKDGDSPACFEATNGLMPVGVCENPKQLPEPSRWDVFMQVNHYIDARSWKLLDSTLGACLNFPFLFPPHNLDYSIFHTFTVYM